MNIATAHARLGSAASSFLVGKHQLLIDGKWVDVAIFMASSYIIYH